MIDGLAPRCLATDDAARYLSVTPQTFKRHVQPSMRPIRIGARVLWDRQDLDRWVDAHGGHAPPAPTPLTANPLDALD